MAWVRWVVIVAAFIESSYMAFDGIHALTVGDYVTPKSGPHAGELGPWASVVSRAGIEPRSTGTKVTFAAVGVAWLVVIAAFARSAPWAWYAMLALGVGTLWYLPIGTILSVIQIVALVLLRSRAP